MHSRVEQRECDTYECEKKKPRSNANVDGAQRKKNIKLVVIGGDGDGDKSHWMEKTYVARCSCARPNAQVVNKRAANICSTMSRGNNRNDGIFNACICTHTSRRAKPVCVCILCFLLHAEIYDWTVDSRQWVRRVDAKLSIRFTINEESCIFYAIQKRTQRYAGKWHKQNTNRWKVAGKKTGTIRFARFFALNNSFHT